MCSISCRTVWRSRKTCHGAHPSKFWRDADDAQLISYIDRKYGTFSARNYDIAVAKVTDDRSYHPIREFLEALPEWDGIPRVDTLLIDYLGAADNDICPCSYAENPVRRNYPRD